MTDFDAYARAIIKEANEQIATHLDKLAIEVLTFSKTYDWEIDGELVKIATILRPTCSSFYEAIDVAAGMISRQVLEQFVIKCNNA